MKLGFWSVEWGPTGQSLIIMKFFNPHFHFFQVWSTLACRNFNFVPMLTSLGFLIPLLIIVRCCVVGVR